jgi:ribosomal protein S18 acetylase RimI-like enzyme
LATAVADALNSGAASLWLGVGQDNIRANLFYEKSGFIVVGTRKFQVGDSFESDFVREKNLHSLV